MPTLDELVYGKAKTRTPPKPKTKEYILHGKKVDLTKEAYQYYVDLKVPIRESQILDFHERYRDQKPYQTVTTSPTSPANTGGNAPANTAPEKEKDCGWFGEKCWEAPKLPEWEFPEWEAPKLPEWEYPECEASKFPDWEAPKFPELPIPKIPEMPDLSWLKYVGIAIGIGILLWLIRPLMKIGANLTS